MGCSEPKSTMESNVNDKDTSKKTLQDKDNDSKRAIPKGAAFQEEVLVYDPNSSESKLKLEKWDDKVKDSPNIETSLLNWRNTASEDFFGSLRDGPPPKYRWAAWKTALRVNHFYEEDIYESLITLEAQSSSKFLQEIRSDAQYVFGDYIAHMRLDDKNELTSKVERIIIAITVYKPKVGYGTGMNYMVAFMLLVSGMNEKEVFWAFIAFCGGGLAHDKFELCITDNIYTKDSTKADFLLNAFNILCEEDKLREHLDEVKITDKLWIHSWILKFYLTFFPFNYCLRFWDYILSSGFTRVIILSAAVLKSTMSFFQGQDFTKCYHILNSFRYGNNLPTPEEIIRIAEEMKLSNSFKKFIAGRNHYREETKVEKTSIYDIDDRTEIMIGIEDEPLSGPVTYENSIASASKEKMWY